MFEIYYEGGGEVPAALSGRYTRYQYAVEDIQKHIRARGE